MLECNGCPILKNVYCLYKLLPHSSPSRLVQIPDCPRHSYHTNSNQTKQNSCQACLTPVTVPCGARGRGFFRRADSFVYISRQRMISLDLCLPSGQGNQPRRRKPALAGLASPRHHRREAGGH